VTLVSRGLMTAALAASLMNVGDIRPVGTFNGVAYVRIFGR
jgi:hypothetical protein